MSKEIISDESVSPIRRIMPYIIVTLLLVVISIYTYGQKVKVVKNAEAVTNQIAEYVAGNIANEIEYAKSSIKLSAITIAQTMTSEELVNPAEIILPMVDNTPFGSIEYIRSDGMNVMNIGDPFDASDRVYYIEGIKGNTGIWNNYHPKTSQENLMNFYTPLVYDGKISGVITGYIQATSQIAPLLETKLYGYPVHGILVDENGMVICSTIKSDYVTDQTLDMLMARFGLSEIESQRTHGIISNAREDGACYKDPAGEGRICVALVPNTNWKVVFIIPAKSFDAIISENIENTVIVVLVMSAILVLYATYVLLSNLKKRKEIALENEKLEKENHIIEEENHRALAEITEIRDIIASANMGTWRIELVEDQDPRMYADDTMKKLLGIGGQDSTPEQVYMEWFENITPEALQSVLLSVERMQKGFFDENTYLWKHPSKGVRYVRCGGTSEKIPGGYVLRGYHYDVDDVVREDQAKVVMLQSALDEKNEYYTALGTLGGIFYSIHVIDLQKDCVVELSAKNQVKEIVNHRQGAVEMMVQVMTAVTADENREEALEFTDLTTLMDRMEDKKIISKQFVGRHIGWFIASFITMEKDENGKPTKVVYTTRIIDEEKKQEESLIRKSQTDEMTGLLNRRAYEEDIYEHNDTPDEENFTYVSLDVNGLKVINDTLGHTAGDELIVGACHCMRRALGCYGKLYRIGGDEFVAILFCDTKKTKEVLADFDNVIVNWTGKTIDSLSVSYGWVSKEEEPTASVRQLGVIAEKRMYEAKSAHYRKKGVDRRGQQDAHKALCQLYTKILKINISEDSYQIINMDVEEQTEEKGFADKISEWLSSFGTSGQVHPEDLENYLKLTNLEYMREYFEGNKTSLHVFYRRKYGDTFKQVMMEIIPANDFTSDNQNLFLYVKDIDK